MAAEVRAWNLPATQETVDRICLEAEAWLRHTTVANEEFDIQLLLRESLTNAVVHGCREDPALDVHCSIRVEPGRITLVVEDPGPGFDVEAASGHDPHPEATHGRGLSLLQAYADEVVYRPPGNHLTLVRRIPFLKRSSMQKLEIQRIGTEVHVKALVDIKGTMLGELHPLLKAAVEPDVTAMIFDLSAIRMVDSGGIGLLIATNNSLLKQGATLRIRGASSDVLQLLKVTRLDRHFTLE